MTLDTSENILKFAMPTSKLFSSTIMQALYDMGYREGVDKISLVTNYENETTSITKKHTVKYGVKKTWVFEIVIPDKYVSRDKPRTMEITSSKASFNIPLDWVFSKELLYNLQEIGYTPNDRCEYQLNYENHVTTVKQLPKVVEGCKYYAVIIPDQYVKPRKEEIL